LGKGGGGLQELELACKNLGWFAAIFARKEKRKKTIMALNTGNGGLLISTGRAGCGSINKRKRRLDEGDEKRSRRKRRSKEAHPEVSISNLTRGKENRISTTHRRKEKRD